MSARVSHPGLLEERLAGGHMVVGSNPGRVTTEVRNSGLCAQAPPNDPWELQLAHKVLNSSSVLDHRGMVP
jgi:hypothetical protein